MRSIKELQDYLRKSYMKKMVKDEKQNPFTKSMLKVKDIDNSVTLLLDLKCKSNDHSCDFINITR